MKAVFFSSHLPIEVSGLIDTGTGCDSFQVVSAVNMSRKGKELPSLPMERLLEG